MLIIHTKNLSMIITMGKINVMKCNDNLMLIE